MENNALDACDDRLGIPERPLGILFGEELMGDGESASLKVDILGTGPPAEPVGEQIAYLP